MAEITLGTALIFTSKKKEEVVGRIAAGFFSAVFPGNISRLFFQPALIYWALKSTEKRQPL
jgi:hypothetical protein